MLVVALASCRHATTTTKPPTANDSVWCVGAYRYGHAVYACTKRYRDCSDARRLAVKYGRLKGVEHVTSCVRMGVTD